MAAANNYPNTASGSNLLVQSEVIRQRMAPYYGEVPMSTVQVKDIGQSVQEYSAKTILDASQSALESIPEYTDVLLHDQRILPEPLPLDSKNIVLKIQNKNIPQIQNVDKPDVFTIRLEFDWNKPHGQWMTQLLKDIKIAKAAGDTETYTRLSAQYTSWADTYLKKGTAPRVMK